MWFHLNLQFDLLWVSWEFLSLCLLVLLLSFSFFLNKHVISALIDGCYHIPLFLVAPCNGLTSQSFQPRAPHKSDGLTVKAPFYQTSSFLLVLLWIPLLPWTPGSHILKSVRSSLFFACNLSTSTHSNVSVHHWKQLQQGSWARYEREMLVSRLKK